MISRIFAARSRAAASSSASAAAIMRAASSSSTRSAASSRCRRCSRSTIATPLAIKTAMTGSDAPARSASLRQAPTSATRTPTRPPTIGHRLRRQRSIASVSDGRRSSRNIAGWRRPLGFRVRRRRRLQAPALQGKRRIAVLGSDPDMAHFTAPRPRPELREVGSDQEPLEAELDSRPLEVRQVHALEQLIKAAKDIEKDPTPMFPGLDAGPTNKDTSRTLVALARAVGRSWAIDRDTNRVLEAAADLKRRTRAVLGERGRGPGRDLPPEL